MKRITSFILALLLIFSLGFSVFADLGAPDFDDWYVYCGIDGFDFPNYYSPTAEDYINGNSIQFTDHIEPGMRVQVYYFIKSTNKYHLLVADDRYIDKGDSAPIFSVSETELSKKFLDEKEPVDKTEGIKKEKSVTGTISADSGVNLRQGPSIGFQIFRVIPHNAKVSFQYVYKNDGYNWGFVTYKGTSGWICTDYVKEDVTKKVEKTKKKTVKQKTEQKTQTQAQTQTQAELTTVTETTVSRTDTREKNIFEKVQWLFDNTNSSILIFASGGITVAIIAFIILLIINHLKKKKQ